MSDEPHTHKLRIHGYIWRGDDQPIAMSVTSDQYPDKLVYMQSPQITEGFRKQAARRGISVGELVDEVNDRIPHPKPLVEWKFDALSKDQLEYTLNMFKMTGALPPDQDES